MCSFFAYGAMVAAEAAGIPFDVLMPNAYLLPARGMPPLGLGVKPAAGPLGRGRDRLVTALVTRQWNKGLPRVNALRASLGLDPLDSFFEQVHRAHRAAGADVARLRLPRRAARHRALRRAPSSTTRPGPPAISWTPPAGDDPLVLVALSSTFQDQASLPAADRRCARHPAGAGDRHDRTGARPRRAAGARQRHGRRRRAALRGAAAHECRRDPRRPRHGGADAGRRRPDGHPPPRPGPGRQRHPGHHQGRRAGREAHGDAGRRSPRPCDVCSTSPRSRSGARQLGESIRRDAASGALVAELEGDPVAEIVSEGALLPSTVSGEDHVVDPRHVVIVVFEGCQPLDAVGPAEVFAGASALRPGAYTVSLVSRTGGIVRGASGLGRRDEGRWRRSGARSTRWWWRAASPRSARPVTPGSWTPSGAWPAGPGGSPRCARVRSSWPRPACSTASRRPRTGGRPAAWPPATRRSASTTSRSSSATATCGPRPA